MFNFDLLRVTTAAVGALILSTLSVTAAVGPATNGSPAPAPTTLYASIVNGQANA